MVMGSVPFLNEFFMRDMIRDKGTCHEHEIIKEKMWTRKNVTGVLPRPQDLVSSTLPTIKRLGIKLFLKNNHFRQSLLRL